MNIVSFYTALTGSATPQQLPANPIFDKISISAKSGNSAPIAFSANSSVSSTNSFLLNAGTTISLRVNDTSQLWASGTAADVFTVIGS